MDFNTICLVVVAILNAVTAWMTWKTKQDIRKVEIATNSMKDALVTASHAAGRQQERDEQAHPPDRSR